MTCFDTRTRTALARDALTQRTGDLDACLARVQEPAAVWLRQMQRETAAWGRVLDLHDDNGRGRCEECGYLYPCLTLTVALAAVLGPVEVTG